MDHNFRFDVAFLASELARLDGDLGMVSGVCTLGLASRFGIVGQRTLPACCEALGVQLTEHHSALGDAVAVALLLRAYAALAGGLDRLPPADPVRDQPWPPFPASRPILMRGTPRPPRTTLAHFVAGLPPRPELNVVD